MRAAIFFLVLVFVACTPEYVIWRGHSPDRMTELRVTERGTKQMLEAGERSLGAHAAIGVDAIAIRGGHVAFPARDGLAWRLYVDGAADSQTWESIGRVVIDARGQVAYAAERGGRWYVVVERRTFGPYARIDALRGEGERIDWIAKDDAQKTRFYRDGIPSRAWQEIHSPELAKVASYVGVDESGEHYVHGDDVSPGYEAVLETTDAGFIAKTQGTRLVWAYGSRVGEGDAASLVTRSNHWAFVMTDHNGARVISDAARFPTWTSIESLSMSDDGTHIGYVGRRAGDSVVVVDGREVGAFAWARSPVFGEGGKFAFVASEGGGAIVRGPGFLPGAFDVIIEDSLALSNDGMHWGAIAGYKSVRRLYFVRDGRPIRAFDLDEWVGERTRMRTGEDARMQALVRAELQR